MHASRHSMGVGAIALGLAFSSASFAAEVSRQRLENPEARNWLHNHRTYDAQRHSPLAAINTSNVKDLRLAYAVAIGGASAGENLQATPLVDDGYMYFSDAWGVVYKIDARDGQTGRIVWRMDPGQEKMGQSNRGVALWGNYVVSVANFPARVVATNRDTGKVVWETNMHDQPDLMLTAAPLAVRDRIVVGAAGGDKGVRDWIASFDAATGKLQWKKFVIPAPGEPGGETWKGDKNAWQTGGGAMWVTGSYDIAAHRLHWGVGNPVPMFDPTYRPGDNLYTNSLITLDPEDGRMLWHHQYTPGDMWDYDEVGSHILFEAEVGGQKRTLVTHSARNGFLYTFERGNGQTLFARPYIEGVNWTKGIDQKTGKPVDYDPTKDIQIYSGLANQTAQQPTKTMCPSPSGGNNFWPTSYSQRTKMLYIPALTVCVEVTFRPDMSNKAGGWRGGTFTRGSLPYSTQLSIADPVTGDTKKKITLPYADYSGALTTGGGLVFTAINDGSFMAFDDVNLDMLWRINLGTGFTAPPMTFEVEGKQYVAILSGGSSTAINKNVTSPELKEMRNQTLLWVFGL